MHKSGLHGSNLRICLTADWRERIPGSARTTSPRLEPQLHTALTPQTDIAGTAAMARLWTELGYQTRTTAPAACRRCPQAALAAPRAQSRPGSRVRSGKPSRGMALATAQRSCLAIPTDAFRGEQDSNESTLTAPERPARSRGRPRHDGAVTRRCAKFPGHGFATQSKDWRGAFDMMVFTPTC